jgi:hypothetical protein
VWEDGNIRGAELEEAEEENPERRVDWEGQPGEERGGDDGESEAAETSHDQTPAACEASFSPPAEEGRGPRDEAEEGPRVKKRRRRGSHS